MPYYVRKSVRAGPFRFNLSKQGAGFSVGVKGLRIGTGPRGHYIHAGGGGIYYRASVGHAGGHRTPIASKPPRPVTQVESNVEMIEVDSGDVLEMRDEAFASILDDINASCRKTRLAVALPVAMLLASFLAGIWLGPEYIALGAAALPAWGLGKWLDSYRRATVMYYDLAEGSEAAFQRMTQAFDGLMGCVGKWHIEAGGTVRDLTTWKRNAGANHLVRRKPTTLCYKLPTVVKSNVTPPAVHVGRQIVFFFPDVALIQDGRRFGAVGYADLKLAWQPSNFVETDRPPHDAQIVDYTWEHPNKKGGPDRRYRTNRQLPVCLYEALHLGSATGVNELLEFSRTGVAQAFAKAAKSLPQQSVESVRLALSQS